MVIIKLLLQLQLHRQLCPSQERINSIDFEDTNLENVFTEYLQYMCGTLFLMWQMTHPNGQDEGKAKMSGKAHGDHFYRFMVQFCIMTTSCWWSPIFILNTVKTSIFSSWRLHPAGQPPLPQDVHVLSQWRGSVQTAGQDFSLDVPGHIRPQWQHSPRGWQ